MRNQKLLVPLCCAVLLVFALGLLPVFAANMTTVPGVSSGAKKFTFSVNDLNNARKLYSSKPQLLLSWQTKVRLANDALAKDAATVKTQVDEVLARADKKYADCSAQDYTLLQLQALCQANEGVQACLDRLRWNCIMGQASQQQADSLANALAAMNIQTALDRMKKEITALEQALYK
jgi:hypothetical protein